MSIPTRGLIYFAGSQSGTSLLSGNGAPSSTAGGPGDFYLDLTDAVLYGPKDASTGWPASGIDFSGVANAEGPLVFDPETQTLSLDPIATSDIQDDAITSAKIAADAVGNSELADDSVDTDEIVDGAVTEAKLDSAVSDLLLPAATSADYGKALVFTPGGPAWFTPTIEGVSGLVEALDGKADLENGKLLASQVPAIAISDVYVVASQSAANDLTLQVGDVVIRSDISKSFIHTGTELVELKTPADAVLSVNGQTGAVELSYSDVGAAAAVHSHSISDITGLQTELDGKADDVHTHVKADITDFSDADYAPAEHTHDIADVTGLQTELDGKSDTTHTHDVDNLDDAQKRLVPEGGQPGQALVYGAEPFWATPVISGVDGLQAALDAKQDDIVRQTLTQSVTVAAGNEVSVDLELGKSYMLTKIESTKEARIRLYQDSASRTADQSRSSTTPPDPNAGLICEVIMDSGLVTSGLLLNPPQFGYNAANSSTTKALVENQDSSADVQLVLTYLKIEQ